MDSSKRSEHGLQQPVTPDPALNPAGSGFPGPSPPHPVTTSPRLTMYHITPARRRPVLASKRNLHAVRVFIPLKGHTNGQPWIKPIRLSTFDVAQPWPLQISFDKTVHVRLTFWSDTIVFYTPFSMAMLRHYHRAAAPMYAPLVGIEEAAQSPERLDHEELALYRQAISGMPPPSREEAARIITAIKLATISRRPDSSLHRP